MITMQGSWTLRVKSKSAAYPQQFVVSGATIGNGTYVGSLDTDDVFVTGPQWSISIMNNPGTGFQLSNIKLKFPRQVGSNYQFDIQSNDAGGDQDFNDLVLTCMTPVSPNVFLLYGNVSTYSRNCAFNPCLRRGPFVIDSIHGFNEAYKNPHLKDLLDRLYPERVPGIIDPNPPDPAPYFKPMVIDLNGEAMQPKTKMQVIRSQQAVVKSSKANKAEEKLESAAYTLQKSDASTRMVSNSLLINDRIKIADIIDKLFLRCVSEPASGVTLSFDEYDRTNAELSGGAYTGTGDRRALGEAMTDAFGNYIFKFTFDMNIAGGYEDDADHAAGEVASEYLLPDVIIKMTGLAPWDVLYESAPYYNTPNLRRINLCIPEHLIRTTSACTNGNMIDSIGNVFIGGNQNTGASTTDAALRRYGYSNYLEASGKISVTNLPNLAQFAVNCAAWTGVLDIFGCLYDETKPLAQNHISWYTIRIKRKGTSNWTFVSENYKHPLFHKRHLSNYIGDNVGSFQVSLHVDGGIAKEVPAYKNIRRELHAGGPDTDWVDAKIDRLIQLNTSLYDMVNGQHEPGTFLLRIDGYDEAGQPVNNKTDLIPLYIHNRGLSFSMSSPQLNEAGIAHDDCGLYRLTEAQMNTALTFNYEANDPYGFLDNYQLSLGRCPSPILALDGRPGPLAIPDQPGVLAQGISSSVMHSCGGFTGTGGLIPVSLTPAPDPNGGWIKQGEYFTVYSFALTAQMRLTNGYNSGLTSVYHANSQIFMERLNP